MSLNWIFFPKTLQIDDNLLNVISVFDKYSKIINSYDNDDNETRKHSNEFEYYCRGFEEKLVIR